MESSEFNIDNTDNLELENNDNTSDIKSEQESSQELQTTSNNLIEYKIVEEPCVSLTIIGENRLTDAEVFFKRGVKFSIKAFFSTLVLTIMKMFI